MSAFAQQSILIRSQRPLSEVELLRSVSSQTWNATDEEDAFVAIATAILRAPGISGFRFEPSPHLPHLPIHETSKPGGQKSWAWAVSPANANGQSWGHVRIFFDPNLAQKLESPVRLAKFVGQQIGILLHRLSLQREIVRQTAHLEALNRITRRRKIISRAAAVLAGEREVSEREAISLMVSYARENRQNLLTIAESLIFGYKNAAFMRPSLRYAGFLAHQQDRSNAQRRHTASGL
jgi:hypothetical protein